MARTVEIYEKGGKKRVRATDARVHFGELMARVRDSGDTIYVERGNQTVMKLVPVRPGEMDDDEEPEWLRNWKSIKEEMRAHLGDRPLHPAPEELIRDDRDNR
jgi:antitoxin (DNA-binding transcriptional repressor) of toxin-antitoxin stability system